ncbi:TetR/AcrR family transcriptional regulator [Umezawaea tangerina]|uniref:TetR family transcriptional regulator n=1 Tax=Umezawaea tangerina TaxID=84725 RepID=A0A2T0TCL8_9PSEU|nr:TetR/AcrR family transcriptional regulator [Umezawaea tangerina]PRY43403.1 TetR family transcriptional regulator [Umezawaea tangerina]
MTTEAQALDGVRERVLEAACELFANRGINSTGVDLVSEVAGVSKRSLYQRFPSKDHLIAAYLPRATDRFLDGLVPAEDSGLSAAGRILEVFAATQRKSHQPDFRGCPVLNATAEIPDVGHPMRGIAVSYKDRLQGYFRAQAEAAGAADPELLAEQLAMVFDGAMSYGSVRDQPLPDSVHATARTLLAAQGVELPQ